MTFCINDGIVLAVLFNKSWKKEQREAFMRKRIVTCVVTLTIMAGICFFPAHGHAATETQGQTAQQKTVVPQLAAPTRVKSKALDSTTIKLMWKKTAGASGYEIYRYSSKKKTYRKIGKTSKTSFKSRGLNADTRYRYKIRAFVRLEGKTYYSRFSKTVKRTTQKSDGQKIVAKARKKIGASYRAGASGAKAFDCSGFVYWVYKNSDVDTKKKVKRTSSAGLNQSLKKYKVGSSIKSLKKAKPGDILLFTRGGSYSHAGIYSGNGRLIHAANARKGVISQSVRQLHNSGTRVAAIIRVVE